MNVDRRGFAKSLTGVAGALAAGAKVTAASPMPAPASLARAQTRLPPAIVTKIRVFYPPNYNPNGPQAFPQSNMVVLVDTDAGITGFGQGGSRDTVRNIARSVIGKNAFDTEMIWQAAFMDGFYSPGKERLHAHSRGEQISLRHGRVPVLRFFAHRAAMRRAVRPNDHVPALDEWQTGVGWPTRAAERRRAAGWPSQPSAHPTRSTRTGRRCTCGRQTRKNRPRAPCRGRNSATCARLGSQIIAASRRRPTKGIVDR